MYKPTSTIARQDAHHKDDTSRLLQLTPGRAGVFAGVVRDALDRVGLLPPPEFLLMPFGRLSPLPTDRWPLVVSEEPRGRLWKSSHGKH